MGAVKNAITDREEHEWADALMAAPVAQPSYWERRARHAEKQYTICVRALEEIAETHVASWQQPASRMSDAAHDALGKVDVLQNEYDKETA
jgi:hypothetical protein